ncbi:uncharacterized protein ACIB01_012160 [Guaruba guarouba]
MPCHITTLIPALRGYCQRCLVHRRLCSLLTLDVLGVTSLCRGFDLVRTHHAMAVQWLAMLEGLQRLKAHKDDEQVERILCLYIHREFRACVLLALLI